jgi:hypothetical protein
MKPGRDRERHVGGWSFGVMLCVTAAAFTIGTEASTSASAIPTLNVTPITGLHDGQTVSVSVGPNGFFTPHSHVNILECADPGGTSAKLPKDITTCDGNTIQGDTILVGDDGSFSEPKYTVYRLPNPTLGEQTNNQPVCDQSNQCVLYVGQNQNDFTAPKLFSSAFSIAGSAGSATTTTPTSQTSTTASPTTSSTTAVAGAGPSTATSSSSVDPSVSIATATADGSATLAATGLPSKATWVSVVAAALILAGSVGRRVVRLRT